MVPEEEAEQVTEKCGFRLKESESIAFKALECGNKVKEKNKLRLQLVPERSF